MWLPGSLGILSRDVEHEVADLKNQVLLAEVQLDGPLVGVSPLQDSPEAVDDILHLPQWITFEFAGLFCVWSRPVLAGIGQDGSRILQLPRCCPSPKKCPLLS